MEVKIFGKDFLKISKKSANTFNLTDAGAWRDLLGITPTDIPEFSKKNAYQQSVWIYSCVNSIVRNLLQLKIRVRKAGVEGSEVADNHEIMQYFLHGKVAPLMTFKQWLNGFVTNKLAFGEAFTIKEGEWAKGKLGELWVLPPSLFKEVFKKSDLAGWQYQNSGVTVPLNLDEVIFDRKYNPYDQVRGLNPVDVCQLSALLDYNAGMTSNLFFMNGSVLPGVIEVKKNLSDPQYERLKQQWEDRHSGKEKSFKPMILEGESTWNSMATERQGNVFPETKRYTREEICSAYNVPPAEVGIYEYANYSNSSQQQQNFWIENIIPESKEIADILNTHIVKPYDPSLEMYFDAEEIPCLQENLKEKAKTAKAFHDMGFTKQSINERLKLGFKKEEIPDEESTSDKPKEDEDVPLRTTTTTEDVQDDDKGKPTQFVLSEEKKKIAHEGEDIRIAWCDMPFKKDYHAIWYEKRKTISIKRYLESWLVDEDRNASDLIDIDGTKLCTLFYADYFTNKEVTEWGHKLEAIAIDYCKMAKPIGIHPLMEIEEDDGKEEFKLTKEEEQKIKDDKVGEQAWRRFMKEAKLRERDCVDWWLIQEALIETEVMKNIKKYFHSDNPYNLGDIDFDEFPYQEEIKRFFNGFYAECLLDGFEQIRLEVGKSLKLRTFTKTKNLTDMTGVNFDPNYTDAISRMKLRLPAIASLTTSMQKEVRKFVLTAIEKGWSSHRLQDALREGVFNGKLSQFRAARIARTETGIAMKEGRHAELLRRSLGRRWVSARDGQERDSHRKEDSIGAILTRDDDVYPVTNLPHPQYPGGAAKEIINCRCIEMAVEIPKNKNVI